MSPAPPQSIRQTEGATAKRPGPAPDGGAQDYRDHLSTADKEGRRQWVYAKKPAGRWTARRTWLSAGLLAAMFLGPFVRIHGAPLLMINIVERRCSILGQIFWPQDAVIFAVAGLIYFTGIILFTAAFGRLWCGWLCPQTVMMEMVFRKIEYLVEGDAQEQKKRAAAPWTRRKILKKTIKLGAFLALSFVVGNTLLAYIIGSDALIGIITEDPRRHLAGLTFMVLFTLLFFAIFARFREQACAFICPYGRLQSTMLDENSLIVGYDFRRGEKRGRLRRDQPPAARAADGFGSCVDCRQCVSVCPAGIDIRDGLQMECVHCTACIDACDSVMDKIGAPRGLVRYASLNSLETGRPFHFTTRMGAYSIVLCVLITAFLFLVLTRSPIEADFLRAPGGMFVQTEDGRVENLYTLKLVNKTMRDLPVELKLEGIPGRLRIMGENPVVVPGAKLVQTSALIDIFPSELAGTSTQLKIGVYSKGRLLQRVSTGFIGPRADHSHP